MVNDFYQITLSCSDTDVQTAHDGLDQRTDLSCSNVSALSLADFSRERVSLCLSSRPARTLLSKAKLLIL